MKIVLCETPEILEGHLRDHWEAAEATEGIVVSGGSTFRNFYTTAPATQAHLFLTDERYVAADAQESTARLLQETYFSRHATPFSAPNTALPLAECAKQYGESLEAWEAAGNTFKTAFLGIGSDGHTASLFPKQFAGLVDASNWVVVAEPELPPIVHRITITPRFLEHVENLIFVATGDTKRDIIRQIVEKHADLPVTYFIESATLYIDPAAAGDISSTYYE